MITKKQMNQVVRYVIDRIGICPHRAYPGECPRCAGRSIREAVKKYVGIMPENCKGFVIPFCTQDCDNCKSAKRGR